MDVVKLLPCKKCGKLLDPSCELEQSNTRVMMYLCDASPKQGQRCGHVSVFIKEKE